MIGPAGFMAAPKQPDHPALGTAPIRCGRKKCKWRGFEDLLADRAGKHGMTHRVCPLCDCASYWFMTPGEIKAWERSKTPNVAGNRTVAACRNGSG